MRHAYVFIYNDEVGTREQLRDFIDNIPEILNWRFELPHTFFLVSELRADEIFEKFRHFTQNDKTRLLFAEISDNKQGWLTRETWDILNNKTSPDD